MDAHDQEREDLDALLASDGWKVFVAHVEKEWGDSEGNGAVFRQAVSQAAAIDADATATAQLRQIVCAQREIHKLLRWVNERRDTLKRRELVGATMTDFSRRGGL